MIKMGNFIIKNISKCIFSKTFSLTIYKRGHLPSFATQAVSTETAAGTQNQNVYNFDISAVLCCS